MSNCPPKVLKNSAALSALMLCSQPAAAFGSVRFVAPPLLQGVRRDRQACDPVRHRDAVVLRLLDPGEQHVALLRDLPGGERDRQDQHEADQHGEHERGEARGLVRRRVREPRVERPHRDRQDRGPDQRGKEIGRGPQRRGDHGHRERDTRGQPRAGVQGQGLAHVRLFGVAAGFRGADARRLQMCGHEHLVAIAPECGLRQARTGRTPGSPRRCRRSARSRRSGSG